MRKRLLTVILTIAMIMAYMTGCIGISNSIEIDEIPNSTTQSVGLTDKETESETSDNIVETTDPESDKEDVTKPSLKEETETLPAIGDTAARFDISQIPSYSGKAYAVVNGNTPFFKSNEMVSESFEKYANLDALGRCGVTIACVGKDIMPTEDRGQIGSVKPTGWHTVKYDCVDGKYLYNRCHLIGFQLTGENANTANLITGTRYMNVDGMLPFENMVADYVKETGSHVMYRVTPVFEGNNLVATGVLMEAISVEDNGDGIMFCVFCYNVQPGVVINYATGESVLADNSNSETEVPAPTEPPTEEGTLYILNTSSKKFHKESCLGLPTNNRQDYVGTREEVVNMGYSPCGRCKP